ncbi:uncharacterized protein LOC130761781 isoform X2 [Actinidia eriantha]|uniref:uncharacterized protein LOC130761781 isoform X2 n=1 Tax=Actinidia eriantha TaxID=165200 RepID=UPI002588C14D|nr:uncharacterized protein LOC130761781 isoform X2 [Actinidia eriantha]
MNFCTNKKFFLYFRCVQNNEFVESEGKFREQKKKKMIERKTKPKLSKVKEREIAENTETVTPMKSVEPFDHWDFLDEIEAPIWVDLNLEVSSGYEDKFHQCSSRQLISMLSRAGEGNANMDFGIQPPSSPKLPSSVSRSRGKKYRTREWGHSNFGLSSNKQHPVKNFSSKSSWVSIGSCQKMKTKLSNGHRKGIAPSKANSVCKSSLTETSGPSYPKPSSIFGDSKTSSSSAAIQEADNKSASTISYHSSSLAVKEFENKSASTITSEICEHQHQKSSEVTSQIVTHTSGLLSALRVNLRKSCATRQAYRVEIVRGRQSEGHKSSSGKSSVGSSSHPGYDAKNTTFPASQNKDTTPDSTNVMIAPQATKDKVKESNVLKESTAKTRDLTAKSKWGSKSIAKSAHRDNVKPKSAHSKAMRLHRVNGQDSVTDPAKADVKVGVNKHNRLGEGKENAMSQRSNNRAVGTVQKVTKQIAPQKSDRTGLLVPKGKISGRSEGKSLTNVTQKVYFRILVCYQGRRGWKRKEG